MGKINNIGLEIVLERIINTTKDNSKATLEATETFKLAITALKLYDDRIKALEDKIKLLENPLSMFIK